MGFKHFFDREIRATHPVEKLESFDRFDGMHGSDFSIKRSWDPKDSAVLRKPDFASDRKPVFRSTYPTACGRIKPLFGQLLYYAVGPAVS